MMAKQITYKEIINIDGREYMIYICDYSKSINELITDQVIQNNDQNIVDHIIDDIANIDYH